MNRFPFKILFSVWMKIWLIKNSVHIVINICKEYFGNKIIQTEINGKPNVVTFRNKAREVLCDFYSQHDLVPKKDKLRIIETAAKLIKDDIKTVKTSHCQLISWN